MTDVKNTARGYFSIGVQNISKPMNLGNLIRSAHAFGANSVFTVNPHQRVKENITKLNKSDTSKSGLHLPYYEWEKVEDVMIPKGCKLVGVEITDDADDLPNFVHPIQAMYILGPEKGSNVYGINYLCSYLEKI
jgi:tRNA G18 (ribose-2'-O)-methylase SpoU